MDDKGLAGQTEGKKNNNKKKIGSGNEQLGKNIGMLSGCAGMRSGKTIKLAKDCEKQQEIFSQIQWAEESGEGECTPLINEN